MKHFLFLYAAALDRGWGKMQQMATLARSPIPTEWKVEVAVE
jgi:hypothetical protein